MQKKTGPRPKILLKTSGARPDSEKNSNGSLINKSYKYKKIKHTMRK